MLLPFRYGFYGFGLVSLWGMLWSFVHFFRSATEQLNNVRLALLVYETEDETKLSTEHAERLKR